MRISDWSSDVCSSDLFEPSRKRETSKEGSAAMIARMPSTAFESMLLSGTIDAGPCVFAPPGWLDMPTEADRSSIWGSGCSWPVRRASTLTRRRETKHAIIARTPIYHNHPHPRDEE